MNKKWRLFRARNLFFTVLFLLLFSAIFTFFAVKAPEESYFVGMQEQGSCIDFTRAEKNIIDVSQPLTVAVWNIYKQNNAGWDTQLTALQQSSDLVLLQEAKSNKKLVTLFKNQEWNTQQTHAFSVFENIYGVLNASQYTPLKTCVYKEKEPFLRLPKSAVVSFYPLSNGEQLALINLHAINFVYDIKNYKKQINTLLENIKHFSGAVIIAGDFNTWNEKRLNFVLQTVAQFGLKSVAFSVDERKTFLGFPLDHVFYRGLNLQTAVSKNTKASDHAWLQASFTFAKPE
ncbi:MAG: endonuclease/exonuclease/phosphatase family protein [Enterovibrio sp.]